VEREPEERVAADRANAANGDVGPGRVGLDLVVFPGGDELSGDLTEERQRVVLEIELGAESAPERRLRKGDGESALGDVVDERGMLRGQARVAHERGLARE